MNFRFDTDKATEVVCLLLQKAGGRMNIMKLVKLIYLLDRLSLDRRGIPVVGGDYLSMRNGPVTSEVLDMINAGRLFGEQNMRWEQCISDRRNHEVMLEQMSEREHVSDAELTLVEEIWMEHGARDQWALAEWCHTHCPEWSPLTRGCAPIAVERIAIALGKAPEQVQKLREETAEMNLLGEIFAQRMIHFGTALKSSEYPFHRCVVISDPATADGMVVLVRITTDDGTWPDRDCILTPQDWDQLEHRSTVAYSTCKFGKAGAALEDAISRQLFAEIPSPSADVLRRITAAARTAQGMPPGARRYLPQV